ncbi:MAG: RNA-binding protein [Proteobacteria bacterium]|nr:RNA-binding protein [Pseudomonadota bacterium]MBU1641470.1 RNA-binding protein [Pseudomonadota bacterium]
MKLYVGNLPFHYVENDVQELFGQYGSVVSVSLILDRDTGRTRGFGFVEMGTRGEGHKAMETLNGSTIEHRKLVVNEQQPKKKMGGRRR